MSVSRRSSASWGIAAADSAKKPRSMLLGCLQHSETQRRSQRSYMTYGAFERGVIGAIVLVPRRAGVATIREDLEWPVL